MRGRTLLVACLVASAIGAAEVVACSSFETAAPAAPDDAAPDNAPPDGPAPDSRPVVDATPEADAAPFCSAHADAALCADFDEGHPVSFHFVSAMGNVAVDQSFSLSPPASMRTISTVAKGAFVTGEILRPAGAKQERFSFDTYQGAPGADAAAAPQSVVLYVEQVSGCRFSIETFGNGARLGTAIPVDGGPEMLAVYPLTAYPPPGTWAHVEALLEDTNGGVQASVTINGVEALGPRQTMCPSFGAGAAVSVGLLGVTSGATTDGVAHFDNVLVEVK